MTVICYKAGVMAADSCVSAGGMVRGDFTKIVRTKHGVLVGAAGSSGAAQRFRDFVSGWPETMVGAHDFNPKPFDLIKDQSFGGIVVLPTGRVLHCSCYGDWIDGIEAPFHAMGSCEDMATGAMAAGASAYQAVAICIAHHNEAAGRVDVVYLADHDQIMHERGSL